MAIAVVMRVALGAGKYEAGDIVSVLPDGHQFGREESLTAWTAAGRSQATFPGWFYIIDIPSMTVAELETYLAGTVTTDPEGHPVLTRRRNYRLNLRNPPSLQQGYRATMSRQNFNRDITQK